MFKILCRGGFVYKFQYECSLSYFHKENIK